jgi:hypothetical protein
MQCIVVDTREFCVVGMIEWRIAIYVDVCSSIVYLELNDHCMDNSVVIHRYCSCIDV